MKIKFIGLILICVLASASVTAENLYEKIVGCSGAITGLTLYNYSSGLISEDEYHDMVVLLGVGTMLSILKNSGDLDGLEKYLHIEEGKRDQIFEKISNNNYTWDDQSYIDKCYPEVLSGYASTKELMPLKKMTFLKKYIREQSVESLK